MAPCGCLQRARRISAHPSSQCLSFFTPSGGFAGRQLREQQRVTLAAASRGASLRSPGKVHALFFDGLFMHLRAKTAQLFQYLHRVLDRCSETAAACVAVGKHTITAKEVLEATLPGDSAGPGSSFLRPLEC